MQGGYRVAGLYQVDGPRGIAIHFSLKLVLYNNGEASCAITCIEEYSCRKVKIPIHSLDHNYEIYY